MRQSKKKNAEIVRNASRIATCSMGMFVVLVLRSKKLLKVATAHGALWSGHTKSECEKIDLPKTKEGFIKTAADFGIEWDMLKYGDITDVGVIAYINKEGDVRPLYIV